MDSTRVAIVHRPGSAATLQEICRAAVGVCEPVILVATADADDNPALLAAARGAMVTRVFDRGPDPDEAIRLCHDLQVGGITTFHDLDVDFCDAIAATLNLSGVSSATAAPWDKLIQRERIPTEVSVPAAAVDSAAELRQAIAKTGFPSVLKPRRATGGSGVAFIYDHTDIAHQAESRGAWNGLMLESGIAMAPHPSGAEHLAGFVSVESVSAGDSRRHVAVFDKLPVVVGHRKGLDGGDCVSVSGDVFPSRLGATDREAVLDAVDRSLVSLGVRWRVTHTEVALTPSGPVVIEVNGRVGGHVNRLLRMVGGVDLVRSALECALGQIPHEGGPYLPGWMLGYYPPFANPAGVVRSAVSLRDVRALAGVRGVSHLAQRGSSRAVTDHRMLNLTASADDVDTLDSCFVEIRKGIEAFFSADNDEMN